MLRALVLAVLFSVVAVPAAHAQILLELVGANQGPIAGGSTDPNGPGQIDINSFSQGGYVVYDAATWMELGRSSSSFNAAKEWDPSSIKLMRAQGDNELLTTCIFRMYRPSAVVVADEGGLGRRMPMPYLTIELVNAGVESYDAGAQGSSNAAESLSFTYDQILYTNPATGQTYTNALRGPGSGPSLNRTMSATPEVPPRGTFEFVLPDDGHVGIDVVDAEGRWVTTLFDDHAANSDGRVRREGTDSLGNKVPPGVYEAAVRTAGAEITRKMVIGN